MENNESKKLGMRWHNFIVFMRGFAGVVGIIISIFILVLSFLGGMNPLSSILGLIMMAVYMYSLEVCRSLYNLESGAPKKLITFYILNMLVNILDTFVPIMSSTGSNSSPLDIVKSILGTLFSALIIISINLHYYDKRKDIFVN